MSTAPHGQPGRGLTFALSTGEQELCLADFALVVAGYTGRDEAAVREHIDELAAIGVPAPDSVPAFYPMDPSLATQDDRIRVGGGNTSGEVEPVLVRAGGRLYLGVGSDHTDRDMERDSVADSKAACPKPLSARLAPLPAAAGLDWDSVGARCVVDGAVYQEGTLAALRIPTDVLALLDASPQAPGDRDVVVFCGTLPLLDGAFAPGGEWRLELVLPDGTVIEHTYKAVRGTE